MSDPYDVMCRAVDAHALAVAGGRNPRSGIEAVRGAMVDAGRDALGLASMIDVHRYRSCICADTARKDAHTQAINAFTALVAETDRMLTKATSTVIKSAVNGRVRSLVGEVVSWERLLDERGGSWFATEARLKMAPELDRDGHHAIADLLVAHAEFLMPAGLEEAVMATRMTLARNRHQDLHPHYLRILGRRDWHNPSSLRLWLEHQEECCDDLPEALTVQLEATWTAMSESGFVAQQLLADPKPAEAWREDSDWSSHLHQFRIENQNTGQ